MKIYYLLASTLLDDNKKIDAGSVGIPKNSDPNLVLFNILSFVYLFFGIVAIITIIMCGLAFVTSNGSADSVKRARDGIIYSIIGLAVVIMAFVFTGFITGRFSAI